MMSKSVQNETDTMRRRELTFAIAASCFRDSSIIYFFVINAFLFHFSDFLREHEKYNTRDSNKNLRLQ